MSFVTVDSKTLPATRSAAAVDPASLQRGDGFVVSGRIVEIRNHTFQNTSTKAYHRHIAFVIDVDPDDISSRVFVGGVEKERVVAYSHNVTRTGHLSTSYEKRRVRHPNAVEVAEFAAKLAHGNAGASMPLGLNDENAKNLHPNVPNRFEFWGALDLKAANFAVGTTLHFKTKGDSIFIDVAADKDFSTGNYAGEHVGVSFADKVASAPAPSAKPKPELEGVAEDEWD